jgi:hypothetical protein
MEINIKMDHRNISFADVKWPELTNMATVVEPGFQ